MSKKPIALIIMDGFGYNHKDYGNAMGFFDIFLSPFNIIYIRIIPNNRPFQESSGHIP